MKRRLATTLASAALLAFVSAQAASNTQSVQTADTHTHAAQAAEQPVERTGQKVTKPVQMSCPVHPEVKARSGKCPKCRMEERKQTEARAKGKDKVKPRPQEAQEGAANNE
jgi:hypothetical protein